MISTDAAEITSALVAPPRTFGGVPSPSFARYGADMASASIIPPATFIEHATRLRARKLEQVASQVEQELRIRSVAAAQKPKAPRKDLSAVLKHFRSRSS